MLKKTPLNTNIIFYLFKYFILLVYLNIYYEFFTNSINLEINYIFDLLIIITFFTWIISIFNIKCKSNVININKKIKDLYKLYKSKTKNFYLLITFIFILGFFIKYYIYSANAIILNSNNK